jgi:hypothetical protein
MADQEEQRESEKPWPFFSHRKDKANIRDIAQQRLTAQVPEVQCQY